MLKEGDISIMIGRYNDVTDYDRSTPALSNALLNIE